ncbi:putative guanine nucleotide-binding protein alpha-3 subunit [Auriscalpium vulgare]|uniref:Guanine nucleotide-binding protein alpha-3 subunit n=1 Tax=Auriscalpium vulgare TaxID=40419 RepID=A0ACB8RQB5_9AGAM|nr:putative guanine nucleotide-binding protein alpha-3 subunit [Auriscalpium vulgare]
MPAIQAFSTFVSAPAAPSTSLKRVKSPYVLARQFLADYARARRAKARSVQIDADLKRQRQLACKILVMGTEGSGKSTVMRSMRLQEPKGVSVDERMATRPAVLAHLLNSARSVLDALEQSGLDLVDHDNADNASFVRSYKVDDEDESNSDHAEAVRAIDGIWHDAAIAMLLNRAEQFHLVDNAKYFLDAVDRIGAGDYVPTDEDMLKARAPVRSSSQAQLTMGNISLHLFEIPMQNRKLMHIFDDTTSIVFCASLANYDRGAPGAGLEDSLALFENVVNSRWFQRTSVLLVLTKLQLLKEKLPTVPLEKYAPDYEGGVDFYKAAKYILSRYKSRNHALLSIYPAIVEAADPKETHFKRLMFVTVKETILRNALSNASVLE